MKPNNTEMVGVAALECPGRMVIQNVDNFNWERCALFDLGWKSFLGIYSDLDQAVGYSIYCI